MLETHLYIRLFGNERKKYILDRSSPLPPNVSKSQLPGGVCSGGYFLFP
jgi:hypothetical protein